MSRTLPLLALWLLSACSQMDMQGQDPKDFYGANPIKNKVASAQAEAVLSMPADSLSKDQFSSLQYQLQAARPAALESVTVESDSPLNAPKRASLMHAFNKLGYHVPVTFNEGLDLAPHEVRVSAAYATIVSPPECPDWRTSPVTTFSNTKQGNIGCATTTNLGLMLEDPRDLERGSSGGHITPNAERSSDAVMFYRHGVTAPATLAPATAPSGSATPTAQPAAATAPSP